MTRNFNLGSAVLLLAGSVCAQNPPQQAPALAKPPLIFQNPNGTLAAKKEPPKGANPKGLVIPRQVVVPFIAPPKTPKH